MRIIQVGVAAVLLLSAVGCTLQDKIRDLGYIPVTWPSTIYKPGPLVVPMKGPSDTIQVSIICDSKQYANNPEVGLETAASSVAKSALNGSFSLDATYQNKISGKLDLSAVSSVSLSLTNVEVDWVSNASVFHGIAQQDSDCTNAINAARAAKTNLGFLKQALKADLEFTFSLNGGAKLDVNVVKDAFKDITGNADVSVTIGPNTETVTGKGLYIGILMPDPTLVLTKVASNYTTTPMQSNIPCDNRAPCSPDGKWLEAKTDISLSASGHRYYDASVDCADGGSGACSFRSPDLFDYGADNKSVVAHVYSYSMPVNVRVLAADWAEPF